MVASSRTSSSGLAFAALVLAFACQLSYVSAAVFTCTGGTVYVVAHADDDLLFQAPDVVTEMNSQLCITTVFLTAGDSGTTGDTYMKARESGNEAAYAQMAGVDDVYTEFSAVFGGQPVVVRTLVGAPQVQKLWFKLPDGNVDGTGFASTGYQTLRELYFGSISTITNKPKTATYTLATLKQAIAEIITARQPDNVRTLDYLSDYDAGDHSDHLTTARIVKGLVGTYAPNAGLAGYMGYPVQNFAPTIDTASAAFQGKINAFFAYTPYDSGECQSYSQCASEGRGEAYWLTRQYVVTPELAQASYIGSSQSPVTLPNGTNVAPLAVYKASSQSSVQPASAAIDGVVSGYPGNYSAEWSTNGEGVGATYTLTWPSPYTITDIGLYDRPNPNDWMKGGTLTFADGSLVTFGALANDGSVTLVSLSSPVTTTSIKLTVSAVSASTGNVGLAEFQAFGSLCLGCALNGTGITSVTQTSAGFVTGNGAYSDLALQATATASSFSDGQGPEKVNNAQIGGYTDDDPADWVNEWASNGELVGAWINLTFPAYYMVDSLIFYDRPNDGDWITGGHVDFDDGSSVSVPALNDDGSATIVNLTQAVNISSLLFTVTSVGPWSNSIGLSELSVSYSQPQTPVNITAPLYVVSNTTITTSNSTSAISLVDSTTDLALNGTPTASSSSAGQGPEKAIDGTIGGYKEAGNGDYTTEWASNGEKAGAWLNVSWPAPIAITRVVLYDRPNLSDRVLKGTLTWSDGTTRAFGALNADGSATSITLSQQVVTSSMLVTITGVSSTTNSIGLSEVSVFGPGLLANTTGNATSTASSIMASATSLANATLSLNSTSNATSTTSSMISSATSLGNATLSLNSTGNATSTASSVIASATSLGNATLSLNSTVNATLTASSSSTLPTGLNATSSSNSTLASLTSQIASAASSLVQSNATSSSNASLPVATGLNATATLSANATLPTLSALSNLTGIPASGSGYSTISLAGNITSSASASRASASSASKLSASLSANASSIASSASSAASSISASISANASSSVSSASSAARASASSVSSVVSTISVNASSSASSASASASKLSASISANLSSSSVSASASASSLAASISAKASSSSVSASKASSSSASSALSSISSAASASAASASSAALASASSASVASASAARSASSSTSSMVVATRSSSSSLASSTSATPTATGLPTAAAQATAVNIALFGTATASSFRANSPPKGVNDGEVDGLSLLGLGDASQEWATANKAVPAWVQLNFTSNYLMKTVYLFGPVNTRNTVGGVLLLSDGTSIEVPSVSSSGTAVSLGPAGKTVSSVRFTITKTGIMSTSVGLAEIKIYNAGVRTCGWLQPNCLVSM